MWMKPLFASAIAVVAGTTLAAAPEPTPQSVTVPVSRVALFSSGVGYFEHDGSVTGDAETVLRFKTDQINDALKSLVLQDADGGTIAAVTYPSQGPLEHTLQSFQIDLSSNPPLAELLNQLRGAKVSVERVQGAPPVEGTVLGVEKQQRPVGEHGQLTDVWIVNLVGDSGIEPVDLRDVSNVRIDDPELRHELASALAALAQARDRDRKPLEIRFNGNGTRRVRIGYVVQTPVWKTSYRLILPDAAGDSSRASLQGWAIVENQTDSDWNSVRLSLVSGRPISFVEDLYQPLYITRPVVQPELYAGLQPQVYAGGIDSLADRATQAPAFGAPSSRPGRLLRASLAASGKAPEQELQERLNPIQSIVSAASAAKVGELFQYDIGSVTLPRQQSAMLPIVTDSVGIERLSIYNRNVLADHPLLGARLTNTTGKFLLQGPLTVFDGGSYAGDARIEDLPQGQQRLISYGIDQQVTVHSTQDMQAGRLLTGRIIKGVLELTYSRELAWRYIAEDKASEPRALVIESPRQAGWKLVEPKTASETTDSLYRFQTKLEPHHPLKLDVRERRVDLQRVSLLPMDSDAVAAYMRSGEIPESVRDALTRIVQLKSALADATRDIDRNTAQIDEIDRDQTRIRENIKSVSPSSAYAKRLLQELDDQETHLQDLRKKAADLHTTQEQRRHDLEDYLANLTVG